MKKLAYLLFASGIISSCMPGNPTDLKAQRNKERLQQFYDQLINAHNANLVDSFFTADYYDHESDTAMSQKEMKEALQDFFNSMPDVHVTPDFMLANGDTVMAKITMKGTNTGPMNGRPATNKSINAQGAIIFVFRDTKIAQRWRFFDNLTMMQQLGLMPGQEADSVQKK